MLVNFILNKIQLFFKPVYDRSFILQNTDWLVGLNIFLLIFSLPFAQSDSIGYFALFAILFTVIKLVTKPGEKFFLSSGDIWLLVYFLFVIISLAGSSLFYLSLKGFLKTLTYIGFYISFIHYLKDNISMLKYILLALTFTVFGESVIGLKQNFLSVAEISGWQDMTRLNPEEVMTRVYGTLKPYNPNLFGGYMLAALPASLITVFLPLKNKHYKTAILGFCGFITALITVILTGCRGAYIGMFFEILLLAIFTYRMLKPFYKKIFRIFSAVISAILFCFIVILPPLKARVFSIFAFRGDSSNSFRFNVYNSCIHMFKDNWILGIGCGNQNFREIYGLYMKTGFDALSAYNIYLETAVESGIFALAAFLAFLYCNISGAVRYIIKKFNVKSVYLIVAVVSLVGMLIHGFVDTVFFRPQIQFVFWIMIGIIRVILRRPEIPRN